MSGHKGYASPALSLSLAGVFRNAARAEEEVEEGEEESGGAGCRGETVDVSSENTGTGRSEQDGDGDGDDDDEPPEDLGEVTKNKKRKKYHRHTVEQIREMEALFKEAPHPDETQRQQLSKKLGLAPRQVKFWFQNRRTQIKAMQERHENSLLKSEMDKLREENRSMRETINRACCPNCGSLTSYKDASTTTEVQQLRIENARLRAEAEKMRGPGKVPMGGATGSGSSACSPRRYQDNRSPRDYYSTGFFGVDKSRVLAIVDQATEELKKMATAREPLWVRSIESGREILNYDEYVREFPPRSSCSSNTRAGRRSIEASRESGVVILDISRLVQSFLDANQWKDMFPCMISKAATVDIIANGEGGGMNGAVQLMFAELQMLTPMVATREVHFIRHCRQQSPDVWAIVDVSIDAVEDNIDASLKCRKLPSGCIIEDKANGHCKVTWVEHVECQRGAVHSMYRPIVNSGVAFGAWHWMATLQQQCERMVFFVATNVPTKDSSGVSTTAGRKSILKLAQRMSCCFCHAIGASSHQTWTKVPSRGGDDTTRISSRKSLNDPGEPAGVILCAVSSVWLPVPAGALFDYLRDETHRSEWDMLLAGGTSSHTMASIAKGQGRGNLVTLHAVQSRDGCEMWFIQDCCTNAYESMVVYAPVDVAGVQSAMSGCDSGGVAILPSGFSILPDGLDAGAPVITTRPEERSPEGGGSLLTLALQVVANASPAAKLAVESVEAVTALLSSTIRNIKKGMQCEDG